jgi:competence protein ComEC
LACGALGLALGLLVGRELPWALPAWLLLGLSLGAFALTLRELALEGPRRLGLWLALAGLGLGLARIQPLRAQLLAPPPPLQGALQMQARLLSDEDPRPKDRRHVFIARPLALAALDGRAVSLPDGDLRLSVDLMAAQPADGPWKPGDIVQVYGTWRGLRPPSNPGEFDFRRHSLGRGVVGSFSARQAWPARRLSEAPAWHLPRLVWQGSQWLIGGLAAGLDGRALTLARGIVLGDKGGFTREDYSQYARSGFADILAVSGTHFTLALGIFLLLARLFTHSRRKQALAGLALGLSYALLTGFEAPVQRAFALFAVWLTARALDWECEAPSSLAFGAAVILLAQPGALWEAGFQLSFFCTLAVILLGPALARELPARWPQWLRLGTGATLGAQAALWPLLAYHFHMVSWPGLLACLVSGLFTAAILGLGIPLAVLGAWVPGVAAVLGWPLERLLLLLDAMAGRMAFWPGAPFSTGLTSEWLLGLVLLWALAVLFYHGPLRRTGLGLAAAALLLGLLWTGLPWSQRHPGETRAWMLDVGQGDSIILRFGDGRVLLVDGGPAQPDAGSWVVLPALRALGVQRLDWVLATHADTDHVGGLAWVLDQMPASVLMHNGLDADNQAWAAALAAAQARGVPLRQLRAGLPRQDDDGPWSVLHPLPPPGKYRKDGKLRKLRPPPKRPNHNAASVVLRVEDWLLLTGDLHKAGERRLLKLGLKPVEVLKAGHHGSKGSTDPAFVRRLRPAHALLSCGAANWFGHPAAPVLQALRPAALWRTDLQGCVSIVKRAGQPAQLRPWRPAGPAELAQPRGAYRSPWRGLKPPKAPPPPEAPENGAETELDEDGDAA